MRCTKPGRSAILAALVLLAANSCLRAAEPWPTQNVTMIVPFGAGGPVDAVARFISHRLEAVLNKPFVVDNRAGASGNIGAAALSRAKPDGHTIMIATPFPMGLNKFMSSNLSFDPQVDFTPVIMIGKSPQIFLANADSPVKSMKQLVDAAKKSPGSLNVGTPGIGTTAHIAVEYFQSIAGVKLTPVHFRTSASLTSDLIGGHVEFATNLVPGFAELVKAGKVRALAVTSDRRSAQLPEVPTMIEQGFAGFDATAWYVLAVPAHTPPDVIAALNANVNAYLASDLGKKQLGDFDVQVLGGTPQDAKAFIDGELAKWEPIIKSAGIKME